MKVIFLDVDGVLNSELIAREWELKTRKGGWGGFFAPDDVITVADTKWGDELVKRVRRIVDETGASIVMSSTWRLHFDVPKFKEMFKLYGWDAPVIDTTPRLSGGRGLEVNKWLNTNPVDAYVIIDDVDQFMATQKPYYVQTDIMTGITEDDVEKAIKILNNELQ